MQRHANPDPISVETQLGSRFNTLATDWDLNLRCGVHMCAVGRVACFEWYVGIEEPRDLSMAIETLRLPHEIHPAKKDKGGRNLSRKSSRLFFETSWGL